MVREQGKEFFIRKVSSALLSIYSGFILGDSANESLIQFQNQVGDAIKFSNLRSKSEFALDTIRQKFVSVGGQSTWKIVPYPTPAQITSSKPRIRVTTILEVGAASHVPRWEIFQKQNADGVCDNISISEFRTENTLSAADCPSGTPSPKNFEVDNTGLASLEQNSPSEQEQRGFVAVPEIDKLSDFDKNRFLSDPAFPFPSSGLEPIPLKFLSFIPDNPTHPQSIKAIKIQVGNLIADVQVVIPTAQIMCGFPQDDNRTCLTTKAAKFCGCYDHADAMLKGQASLKDGTEIHLVEAAPGSGFKVWKETNGNRILKSTGLWASHNDWQKKLTPGGTGFSNEPFTDIAQLSGRVCPPNVFLNYSTMTATDRCLYYDRGRGSQSGGNPGWPAHHNSGLGSKFSYYEGNSSFCEPKSMRLPVVYETTLSSLSRNFSYNDGISPLFAGPRFGVPARPGEFTFTASVAYYGSAGIGRPVWAYWKWQESSDNWGAGTYATEREIGSIRCVLP